MDSGEHLATRITQPLRLVAGLTGEGGRRRWKFLSEVRAVEWVLIERLVIVRVALLVVLWMALLVVLWMTLRMAVLALQMILLLMALLALLMVKRMIQLLIKLIMKVNLIKVMMIDLVDLVALIVRSALAVGERIRAVQMARLVIAVRADGRKVGQVAVGLLAAVRRLVRMVGVCRIGVCRIGMCRIGRAAGRLAIQLTHRVRADRMVLAAERATVEIGGTQVRRRMAAAAATAEAALLTDLVRLVIVTAGGVRVAVRLADQLACDRQLTGGDSRETVLDCHNARVDVTFACRWEKGEERGRERG